MIMSRSQNYSTEELDALLSCLESMKDILLVTTGPEAISSAEQRKAWDEIARVVNSVNPGVPRNGRNVRLKWVDLRYRTRKKLAMLNDTLTAGGTPSARLVLSNIEERVLQLVENANAEAAAAAAAAAPSSSSGALKAVKVDEIRGILEKYQPIKDEMMGAMDFEVESQPESSTEADLQEEREISKKYRNQEDICNASRERVRKHRERIRKKHDNEIKGVIVTQRQTYQSVKNVELKMDEHLENGRKIVQNQEEMINRLDAVCTLMSEVNGHMENLNDNLNILIQVIANKHNIQIVQNE